MKILLFICCMLLTSECHTQNTNSDISLLTVKFEMIPKLISEVFLVNESFYNWKKTVFAVRITPDKDIYELKLAILSESELNWLLNQKKESPYGYFERGDIRILVFGEANSFFDKTEDVKILHWLKQLPQAPKSSIDLPPSNLEITVRCYSLSYDKIELKNLGNYPLFD